MKTGQKTGRLMTCVCALVLLLASSAAAQKTKCTDWPLEVSIVQSDGSALGSDTKGTPYQDGLDGVSNTVIHVCSGSYDATVSLIRSRRYMGFDFSGYVDGSAADGALPTWTEERFYTKPFLNVRNVLWGRTNPAYAANPDGSFTFKTRMSIGYIKGPGDKSEYVLRFLPEINPPDGPSAREPDPFIDDATVPVTVVDDPSACVWTVTVDDPFVAVLYKTATDGHSGRFRMPFQLQLKAKTCPSF